MSEQAVKDLRNIQHLVLLMNEALYTESKDEIELLAYEIKELSGHMYRKIVASNINSGMGFKQA
jgi:hypothetical protein